MRLSVPLQQERQGSLPAGPVLLLARLIPGAACPGDAGGHRDAAVIALVHRRGDAARVKLDEINEVLASHAGSARQGRQ